MGFHVATPHSEHALSDALHESWKSSLMRKAHGSERIASRFDDPLAKENEVLLMEGMWTRFAP